MKLRTFFHQVGTTALIRVLGGALLLASQLLLAGWLAAEDFGTYSLAWAWVAVLGALAGLGLPGTCVRYVARYRAVGDEAHRRELRSFARTRVLAASAAVSMLGIGAVTLLPAAAPYADALRPALLAIPALALLDLYAAFSRGYGYMAMAAIPEQIVRPLVLIGLCGLVEILRPANRVEEFVVACTAAYALAAFVQRAAFHGRVPAPMRQRTASREGGHVAIHMPTQ